MAYATTTQSTAKALFCLHSSSVFLWHQAGLQSNGVGQRGACWHSLPGNVHITGCFLNTNQLLPGQISIVVGVALAQMLENLGITQTISLKWPNDLLIDGKKCGGVLIERQDAYFIGIGINVNSHPENVDTPATCLNLYGDFNLWDISLKVKNSVTNALEVLNTSLSSLGAEDDAVIHADGFPCARNDGAVIDFSIVQKLWWKFAKRSVHQWITKEPINGEVVGIDNQGQLLIKMANGSLQTRHNRL